MPLRLTTAALFVLSVMMPAQPIDPAEDAWAAWHAGAIGTADALARAVLAEEPGNARARHLRIVTAALRGEHRASVDEFARLGVDYAEYSAVARVAIDAWLHLGDVETALDVALRTDQPESTVNRLRQRSARPLGVMLEATAELPFLTDNMLGELMPAVAIEIDGTRMEGHLDTGGGFLTMAPSTAEALGIELIAAGSGVANNQRTDLQAGIAPTMTLGEATLTNVPVTTVGSLEGQLAGLVIVGTNILQQFLTTWDNGVGRLILTPRVGDAARRDHLARHAAGAEPFDFFLARDHFLWARGDVGERQVTFFLDTGLVALDPRGRQASMGVPIAVLRDWGVDPGDQDFVESGVIRLGPASRPDGAINVWPDTRNLAEVFGLRPEALLSFGFFKHFDWTIDFDAHRMYLVPIDGEVGTEGDAPAGAPATDLQTYAGSYEVAPGVALQVTVGDAGLLLQAPGQQRVPMTHEGPDSFAIRLAGAEITFERDADGNITALVLRQAGNSTRAMRAIE